MSIAEEKRRLRSRIRADMRAMSPAARRKIDRIICQSVIHFPPFARADTVFCFVGIDWEIETSALIESAFDSGKRVTVPLCTASGTMEARVIRSFSDLQTGAYNIPEPAAHCSLCPPDELEFAAVPCIACDTDCHRLGQGGGYYDRFLERTDCYSVALCRETALLPRVPTEPWDRPMDCVVTETGFYYPKREMRIKGYGQ